MYASMGDKKSNKVLLSRRLLASLLLITLITGPGLAIGSIRGFLITTFGMSALYFMNMFVPSCSKREYVYSCIVFLLGSGIVFVWHAFNVNLTSRYFLYLYYYFSTFLIFLFSFWAVQHVQRRWLVSFITVFVIVSFFLSLIELSLGSSLFESIPVPSGEFQVGSGFWANKNNAAVAFLIFNCFIYFSGYKARFYMLSAMIALLSLLLDAKIALVMVACQVLLFALFESMKVRVVIACFSILIVPVLMYAFQHEFYVLSVAFSRAYSLLNEPQLVQELANSGQMFSGSIRVYSIQEMFRMISSFEFGDWLFGMGFGSINIAFKNVNWQSAVQFFPPHFYYLEIFVYSGLAYYVIYSIVLSLLSKGFPLKEILLLSPCFIAIVAVSSAVYFPPFYFLLAIVCDSHRRRVYKNAQKNV